MARAIANKRIDCHSEQELRNALIEQSRMSKGAWIADVYPFGSEVWLRCFPNVSSIPDEFLGVGSMIERGCAVNGKIVPFSQASIIRERNRGMNCDR